MDMYSELQKAQMKDRISRIERIIQYFNAQKLDSEMRTLVFVHEIERLQEEITVLRLSLDLESVEQGIDVLSTAVRQVTEEVIAMYNKKEEPQVEKTVEETVAAHLPIEPSVG